MNQAIAVHHLSVGGRLIAGTTKVNRILQTSNDIPKVLSLPLGLAVLATLKFGSGPRPADWDFPRRGIASESFRLK